MRLASFLVLLAAALTGRPALGQPVTGGPPVAPPLPDTTAARYGSSGALVLLLTEYGFGVGGGLRARLTDDLSLVAEVSAGAGRDEREQTFVGLFGERLTPFKRNYVALVPVHIGVERRLFREAVEDNFRPFAVLALGPTLAYQWPYFDDLDGDGRRDAGEGVRGVLGGVSEGEIRVGFGGEAAVGAFFGRGRRTTQAVRFGFRGTYFPAEVDLLEIRPEAVEEPSRKGFLTPVVSFHIARLL